MQEQFRTLCCNHWQQAGYEAKPRVKGWEVIVLPHTGQGWGLLEDASAIGPFLNHQPQELGLPGFQ